MYLNQEHPYDCAPTAIFNAMRAFRSDTPYHVFEDIKQNVGTCERHWILENGSPTN